MPASEAQIKATQRYKAKAYKRIPLDVKIEEFEQLKAYTERTGESVNGFIRRLIRNEIERGIGTDADGAPELDEVEAIERANKSIIDNGTILHDSIDWD